MIDGSEATRIVDRAIPPDGLEATPGVIKSVLWCLRGLGAPGTEIGFYRDVIIRRTCWEKRSVSRAMHDLRQAGILVFVKGAAPGRPAMYRMDYERLNEWVPEDERREIQAPDGRTTGTRTGAPEAPERAHLVRSSESTGAPEARTGAPEARTGAPQTPDLKVVSCNTCNTGSGGSAAAAEDHRIDREAAEELTRNAGVPEPRRETLARVVAEQELSDRELVLTALERLSERMAGGRVQNPTGLLVSLLRHPGGPEPAERTRKRRVREARAREEDDQDRRLIEDLQALPDYELAELFDRVDMLIEHRGVANPKVEHAIANIQSGDIPGDISDDELRPARDYIRTNWGSLTSIPLSKSAHIPGGAA